MSTSTGVDPHTSPQLGRSALIVIDTQVDFCDGGASPIAGTTDVLPAIGQLLAAYRNAQLPIIHVVRLYDGDDVDLARRTAIAAGAPIVRPGSAGSQIAPTLLTDHADPSIRLPCSPGTSSSSPIGNGSCGNHDGTPFTGPRWTITSTRRASPPSSSPDATTPTAPAPPSTAPANATTGYCSSTTPSPGYNRTTSMKPHSWVSATPRPHPPPPKCLLPRVSGRTAERITGGGSLGGIGAYAQEAALRISRSPGMIGLDPGPWTQV